MRLSFILKTALVSLNRNKVRSLLTVLGVIIGVSSVILLTAIGSGLKNMIQDQFQSLGSNIIYVMPGNVLAKGKGFSGDSMRAGFLNSKLKTIDVNHINRLGSPVVKAVPVNQLQQQARYRTNTYTVTLTSSDPEYAKIRDLHMVQGRFFTQAENQGHQKVAVIGHKVKTELFPHLNPIGKQIILGKVKFKIIGVAEKKGGGGMGGPDFDSWVYLPIQTTKQAFNTNMINVIIVKIDSDAHIPLAKKRIQKVLAKRLSEDDFSVIDQTELLATIQNILGTMTAGLAGIAAISLLVGGIGIMNIMLVSVTERTREIGLRKAVGATAKDILLQFLLESSILSSFGGALGILLGSAGALILNRFFPASPTLGSIGLAFTISFLIGVVFGVVPARKAAQLSPIEAIRYE